MTKLRIPALVAALVLAAGSLSAHAASFELAPDGTWYDFYVADGSAGWLDAASEPASFTFTSAGSFVLRVVDYFFPGDGTQVYANGVLLGTTSDAAFDTELFAASPGEAFGDARWSQASWTLAAGSYTFTGLVSTLPAEAAVLALSVTAVPEPQAAWMVTAGLGLLLPAVYRQRRGRRATRGASGRAL